MAGNIILSFSTLAAAFRLKAPLPPYLPPAEEARRRLVSIALLRYHSYSRNLYIGRSHSKIGRRQKTRSERITATAFLCLRLDDEGSDDGARDTWANTARCIWGDWAVIGRLWDAILADRTYCVKAVFTLLICVWIHSRAKLTDMSAFVPLHKCLSPTVIWVNLGTPTWRLMTRSSTKWSQDQGTSVIQYTWDIR